MIPLAHVGGMPVEELLPSLAGPGAAWWWREPGSPSAAPPTGARPMSGETLGIERTFQAPAQAVFDAWTSEEVLRRWFHGQRAWETPEAQVDLRLGGAVRVVMRDPEKGAEHGGGGHYTEIDPPEPPRLHLDLGQRRGPARR